MEIGNKIKNRRKELSLTMNEVAQRVGVSEATVSRWESGDIVNMRRDKIVLLAKALEVSPAFIMDWENESSSPAPTPDKEDSKIDVMIATESKDLSDKDKHEILHLIQYKKRQTETTSPFQSSRVRTTADLEDHTERIAAYGGMEDNDDEPLMT